MPRETTRVRVAFQDVDASQRIHFSAMFRFFEIAEHALMRTVYPSYASALRERAFRRAHVEADFRGPISHDEELDVEARVERVERTSWSLVFGVRKVLAGSEVAEARPVSEGRMTIVALDAATGKPMAIPTALRKALARE